MTRRGWLLFIAISIFWGIPYFFIKIAVLEIDPAFVVFARVGIASLVLLPLAIHRGVLGPLRQRWPILLLLTCMQIVAPFLLISYGEQHIASSLTSLIIAAEPLLVALLALIFDASERVGGLRLVGLLIGLLGVALLLGFNATGDEQRLLGIIFVLLATTCYAASALLMKRPGIASLPGLGVVTFECVGATILTLPLATTHLPAHMPSPGVLASLLILGLICTALAYLTLFALISEVGASRGTVFTYINPVVSVILGTALLSEQINAATIAGFLLIILGAWLSTGGDPTRLSKRLRPLRNPPSSP
ncbi:DMT family transporter [Dictyobacter aurantiacus]|uniref:Membrane protein n=1 Tax=Dictyobacter aurantiacus TaxID=1936993 RepID=A0A401ZKW6_9CHLR|nr:DMT family transporter [Dictyobacter aurantiacus]GCE07495.1 membrane protein [Dictyobacter aurantiacus]